MRALLLVLIFGCEQHVLVQAPDGGGADAGGGAVDAGPPISMSDAGVAIEPIPGGECDQQDDCNACAQCSYAPFQTCNGAALACEENSSCLGLNSCVGGCSDSACVQGCGDRFRAGVPLFLAFYECMFCDACPADCRERHPTWCEEPPF